MNTKVKLSDSWIERLGLEGILSSLRQFEVYADALTWSRFFGSLLLGLLLLIFLSGAFMTLYYSPVPGSAYDSVDYTIFTVPFGGLLKGIHHYSWNLLLIVMGLQLTRGFLVGAYKNPRQFVWITGLFIILLIPAFIITGDLLPWDQRGYWSTQVRLSIIQSTPVIGDISARLLKGGPLTGIVALTRFYVLHILLLPPLLLVMLGVHFHFLHHSGVSAPLVEKRSTRRRVPFFPVIFNRWLILFLCTILVMALVSWYWPAPFGDPADPTDSTFVPKPEWWVLFLNQLVSIFTGKLSVVGSVLLPGALATLLMALPFIDVSSERHPLRRKKTMLVAALVGGVLFVLSLMGYIEHYVAVPH